MNLAACPSLRIGAEQVVWYRAIPPERAATALSTAHTVLVPSRFRPADGGRAAFPLLYLSESHLVALMEVEALFGGGWRDGGFVPNPDRSWIIINVRVTLQRVADLTDPSEQAKLGTTVQELTGDWKGYHQRSAHTPVRQPTGPAPTQDRKSVV